MARGEKQEKRESKKKREKGIIYARTLDIYREAALTTRSHSLSANHSAAAATTLARSRPVNLDPGNMAPSWLSGLAADAGAAGAFSGRTTAPCSMTTTAAPAGARRDTCQLREMEKKRAEGRCKRIHTLPC